MHTHMQVTPDAHQEAQNTNSIRFSSNLLCCFGPSGSSVRYGCNTVKILILLHKLAVVQHANSLFTVQRAHSMGLDIVTAFLSRKVQTLTVSQTQMKAARVTISSGKPRSQKMTGQLISDQPVSQQTAQQNLTAVTIHSHATPNASFFFILPREMTTCSKNDSFITYSTG